MNTRCTPLRPSPARSGLALLLAAGAAAWLAGCGMSKQEQLEAVARDWCMTIRASQVIPVYPLTEDLQPGDVFLVQLTVDKQQQAYEKKGFLPLDNHLARIAPDGYRDFYKSMFLMTGPDEPTLPGFLQRDAEGKSNWSAGPGAAFPSYSFSVDRGAGLNLALPISGVPVGLSLLGAQTANGSVTIEGARTIGLDIMSLHKQVEAWASKNREFLKKFAPQNDSQPNYIRVVTRVYLTGSVDIALSDARSMGAGADVGQPRPVDLLTPRAPASLDESTSTSLNNSRSAIATTNGMLADNFTPSRPSGSNAGLTPEQIRAKTDEKSARLEEERRRRSEAAADAEQNLEEKDRAAQPAREALDAAQEQAAADRQAVADARAALDALPPGDPTRDAAAKALEEAKAALAASNADVETKRADPALLEFAAAQGQAEVASQTAAELTQLIPGGSVRVTAASSRFISLRQKFDPPLVLGYLGFDMEIREGGKLGPPIPTHAHLSDPATSGLILPTVEFYKLEALHEAQAESARRSITAWIGRDAAKRDQARAAFERLFPDARAQSAEFGGWLLTAPADDLRRLMAALNIAE